MLAGDVKAILGPGGLLASETPGWEPRPGQLSMAERVARALEEDERLLVEAGTGTGKTLAYLVPALLSGRKIVVSTATRTLQDQIARVDLPRLARIWPGQITFAVMKGLSNYVCLRRLEEHARQAVTAAGPDPLVRVRAWLGRTPTGDRADLEDLADDAPVWREITSSPETRIGARCRFFDRCFVTAMKRQALEAQLVVVNHHLFFADLALRSRWPEAQVLPPHEAVVFDEAHALEEIATEFFGLHVSTAKLGALARDIVAAPGLQARKRTVGLGDRLAAAAAALSDALRARIPAPRPGSDEVRMPWPADLWSGAVRDRYHRLDALLEESVAWLDRQSTARSDGQGEGGVPELAGLGRRAAALREDLGALVDAASLTHVRWLTATARGIGLRASPIDVGPALGRALDAHGGPVVFTSATLTVAGSFAYARARIGLGDAADEVALSSPFRYDEQALLYLASDLPDPTEAGFAEAAADRAAELCLITGGRALVLFTSYRALRIAEHRMRGKLSFPVLVQGERPRHVLLATLKEQVGSVLLATGSFWEGVDIPGEALSLVVMDKIPFAPPDDPLTAARLSRIRDQGGDPFAEYQLPQAAIALEQGFGRLIRTRTDRGVVALLDGRILRRPYGATLIASLPRDCPRTEVLADVSAFWNRPAHDAPAPIGSRRRRRHGEGRAP